MKHFAELLGIKNDGTRRVSKSPDLEALEQISDVVLAYRPKSKQPKPRKRKKSKGRV